jgi:MoxR-like ATPase
VLQAEEVLRLQDLVRGVPIADAVVDYAVRLAAATRPGESKPIDGVHKYVTYGASPRASQYLVLGGKARAVLAGKYHVDFDDIRALAGPVLRHRLVLNFHARADGVDADALVRRLLEAVAQEA